MTSSNDEERRAQIYSLEDISLIENCSRCPGRMRLARLNEGAERRNRCDNANRCAPPETREIRIAYLGEAPPWNGNHLYDSSRPLSTGRQSISDHILKDLRTRGEIDDTDLAVKQVFLNKLDLQRFLAANGIVIIDCCQCSIPKSDRTREGKSENRTMLKACFEEHTLRILGKISDKYNGVEIRPAYGSARKILSSTAARESGIIGTWTFTGQPKSTVCAELPPSRLRESPTQRTAQRS